MIRRHPLIGSAGSKYGLVYTDNNAVFLERQTANGAITDSKKLKIKIKELKGKSFVWNQLVKNGNFATTTGWIAQYGSLSISNNIGVFTLLDNINSARIQQNISFISGHKYFFGFSLKSPKATKLKIGVSSNTSIGILIIGANVWSRVNSIYTVSSSDTLLYLYCNAGGSLSIGDTVEYSNALCIDLTLLGIDNLTTVEEVEAWLANNVGNFPYYAFNSGTILNSKFNIFESVEFNQWDEEWEFGGINANNGTLIEGSRWFRTTNYIYVKPNTDYYVQLPESAVTYFRLFFYRVDKTYISAYPYYDKPRVFTTPDDCYYLKFIVALDYYGSTTYNHDICINLSNPIHNGQYKPYKHHIINLNLTTLTGKVNGEGESVVICPDGLKSAGTAYDYFIIDTDGYVRKVVKVIESVVIDGVNNVVSAMETLSNVANRFTFQGANNISLYKSQSQYLCDKFTQIVGINIVPWGMQNTTTVGLNRMFFYLPKTYDSVDSANAWFSSNHTKVYFELATPITYILDNPIYVGTFGHSYGVERILPQNTEEPYTTPANMIIDYLAKG